MTTDCWTTIGEIAEVFDGPHATPKKTDHGPVFLGISSLNCGSLDLSKSENLSEDDFLRWTKRVTPKAGDVVFSYETRLGEAAIIPKGLRCCLGRRMGLLRPKLDKVLPDYLLYAYLGPDFQGLIKTRTIHGSTVDRIALKDFPNFPIQIPPLDEQKSIINVLKSLDDKIELNRQINQTLEQITQTIFKSWFVDFEPVKAKIAAKAAGRDPERAAMCAISGLCPDGYKLEPELDQLSPEQYQQLAATAALFPDELVESEFGLIPVGWEVVSLDSLSAKISKGTTPTKQDIASVADDPLIPFIKVKDIREDGELNRNGIDKIPDSVHRGALKRSILNTSDILFSIAGSIGRIAVVEKDLQNSNANQAVAFVRLKNSDAHLGLCLQFLKSQRLQDAANAAIVQGVQANLSLGSLGGFKILLPSKDVLAEWNNKYSSLFGETRCLAGEIRTLSTLRDTLLPKLLSGELSIEHAQSAMESVV